MSERGGEGKDSRSVANYGRILRSEELRKRIDEIVCDTNPEYEEARQFLENLDILAQQEGKTLTQMLGIILIALAYLTNEEVAKS